MEIPVVRNFDGRDVVGKMILVDRFAGMLVADSEAGVRYELAPMMCDDGRSVLAVTIIPIAEQ